MVKIFYNAQEIADLLGYKKNKAYSIIKELNIKLKEESENKGQKIETFNGRIRKDYFEKAIGLERNLNSENDFNK